MSSNISFPKIKLSIPRTFYVPLALAPRRPFSGIDYKALDTTHYDSIENTQVEMKIYVYLSIKLDTLLENHLAYTFNALTSDIIIKSPIFDDVGMMLSCLENL